MLRNFLPRDCPRVCYWDNSDRKHIHVEQGWRDRIEQTTLFLYQFEEGPFFELDKNSGYFLSRQTVDPIAVIRIKDLIGRAKELGMPAVAQTDHGNMFGAIDFYKSAFKGGVKPILGSEVYFTPGSRFDRRPPKNSKALSTQDEQESKHQIHHLVLLCKNQKGYENLCKMLSVAYLEGFYYKPRVDLELLKQYSEGLVATTACLKGEVAFNFFTGQEDKAHSAITKLHDIFQDDEK